ncbi:hypothetical protein [Flavobacterium microcysteis]|uniref:Uncharacterized protein n=1 Tax=Flavobacterium microcysteis TaxID=2596891 RepID=A0A501Q491_9FLAO|nr:hypothetical protein [Flavobacterium microcysteis]TPD67178.1 hypothetical protein FJA49_12925 [Flavobacterium microcysteis]
MKQLKRTPYFLVSGIFLFLSCQTEEIPVIEDREKQTRQVTKVSFSTFKKQTGLIDFQPTLRLPQNKNGPIAQRNSKGYTLADFSIDTKEITQTVAGEKTSYVFPITPIKGEIENSRFYLVVYNKEGKWLEMIIQSDYSVDKDGDPLQTGFKEIYASSARGLGCTIIYSWVLKCNGRGECAGGVCDKCSICLRGFADRLCPPINKQDYYDGGFTKPGGGGGGGSSNPNPNPNPEVIIEMPLLPHPRDNEPCKELNKMIENTKIKDSYVGINGLKSKVNENIEYGFAFKRTPGYDDVEPIPPDYYRPNVLNMDAFVGGKYFGANHIHSNPVNTETFPMFPAPDLLFLFKVAALYNWDGLTPRSRNYALFVLTLTTPDGTYAIKIKNYLKLAVVMGDSSKYIKMKRKIENRFKDAGKLNTDKLIKALLVTMNEFDVGVGLYEAEADFSNWKELTLSNPNDILSEIKKTPCN